MLVYKLKQPRKNHRFDMTLEIFRFEKLTLVLKRQIFGHFYLQSFCQGKYLVIIEKSRGLVWPVVAATRFVICGSDHR